ncbi:TNF receptor-associated factor 5-like [Watersipora subatra]|uniref:TNF receptor-associated factor 5-like n=1 Tax=Watersipora subatra TaxID=2589382 RepID=UPI00355C60FB
MKTRSNSGQFHTSLETDQYQKSLPSEVEEKAYAELRPNFVNERELRRKYPCSICANILVRPHQTTCGRRVCKSCIDKAFGDRERITPCPLNHDDEDDDEEEIEECKRNGLHKRDISKDTSVHKILQKEKCYCKNKEYGCHDEVQLKRLSNHEKDCKHKPVPCPNKGCPESVAELKIESHQKECLFSMVPCSYCQQHFKRKDIEEHVMECDSAGTQCPGCGKSFKTRKMMIAHQRVNEDCLTKPDKCFYYEHCGFKASTISELKKHLHEAKNDHLEALALQVHHLSQKSTKPDESEGLEVRRAVNKRIKPLERTLAELSMEVVRFKKQLAESNMNGESLESAMKMVETTSKSMEALSARIANIERQIKDSGLDRVTLIESHSQSIKKTTDLLIELEKRVRNLEATSYDGTMIWKIKDYKKRKNEAIRGRQMSIYSHPFYTSRTGYKMCLRAYINGDGLGRGKCLSLFFVVMRGEYDELLEFPFRQRVTFTLLSPRNPCINKVETFLPDPDSSSFRRPQTEMNIASGCPQFVPHSDVESSNYLISDCIYIRVAVEAGGDRIA